MNRFLVIHSGAILALGFGQSNAGANDTLEKCRKELETNPRGSLAHYRIGEIFFTEQNYQSAANEFREALNGDFEPAWVEARAPIHLGTIFNLIGQSDRVQNEYRLAQRVNGNPHDQPPASGIYQVGHGIVAPQPLWKTEPDHTEEARLAGLEGAVSLTGTIPEHGVDMQVSGSLGFGLDRKALEAIQH